MFRKANFPSLQSRLTLARRSTCCQTIYQTVNRPFNRLNHQSAYQPSTVEKKWQERWLRQSSSQSIKQSNKKSNQQTSNQSSNPSDNQSTSQSINQRTPSGKDFYQLVMFPYPSGALHMGHVRVYTLSDVIARSQRMLGSRVLHPMGWDAFGLPAENAAIARNTSPAEWTMSNIANMKLQMNRLGFSFDWDREVATCDPSYYAHTQSIFLQLFTAGLAYQRSAHVNWDPVDMTVLANEQVDATGHSWRSGAKVERKLLNQWFVRITDYAEPLLQGLDSLNEWPSQVKAMQRNWIGKSEGASVVFNVKDMHNQSPNQSNNQSNSQSIRVFTTRVDTLFGVSYIVLAPEHPLIKQALESGSISQSHKQQVEDYQSSMSMKTDVQRSESAGKTAVDTGLKALHPLTGEELPILISEYVLMDYGTGAVMGVPAHDSRDRVCAQLMNLPIVPVVEAIQSNNQSGDQSFHDGEGVLINSGQFTGQTTTEARANILHALEQLNCGEASVEYRLRDWLVSRQRYWGAPIPIIHCSSCGAVPVPMKDLPVKLPELETLTHKGGSPLASEAAAEWRSCKCPKCGGAAQRDTDTLDTFVDSSWYFLRYLSPDLKDQPFDPEIAKTFMPVHLYIGGIEHAILHLLYSRFFTHFFHTQGLLDHPEPFKRLLTQGMVQGATYRHPITKMPLDPLDIQTVDGKPMFRDPNHSSDELIEAHVVWEKMSKSKKNGVEPGPMVDKYGADVIRMFMVFKAPPEKALDWDERAVAGHVRWLGRLNTLTQQHVQALNQADQSINQSHPESAELAFEQEVNTTIRDVTAQIEQATLNVALAKLMQLSNSMSAFATKSPERLSAPIYQFAMQSLTRMLAPFAPHYAAEMYDTIMRATDTQNQSNNPIHQDRFYDVHSESWPQPTGTRAVSQSVAVVIAVSGKKIGTIDVVASMLDDRAAVEEEAKSKAQRVLGDRTIKRVVYVINKDKTSVMVNFVV